MSEAEKLKCVGCGKEHSVQVDALMIEYAAGQVRVSVNQEQMIMTPKQAHDLAIDLADAALQALKLGKDKLNEAELAKAAAQARTPADVN